MLIMGEQQPKKKTISRTTFIVTIAVLLVFAGTIYFVMNGQINQQQAKIDNLLNVSASINDSYNSLFAQYNGLNLQYNNTQTQYDIVSSNYTTLQDQYSALQDQYSSLQADRNNLYAITQLLKNESLITSQPIEIGSYFSGWIENIGSFQYAGYFIINWSTNVGISITISNLDYGNSITLPSTGSNNSGNYIVPIDPGAITIAFYNPSPGAQGVQGNYSITYIY